jgi:hypothetical protein
MDHVSDSFAVLRRETCGTVGAVMDPVMPSTCHTATVPTSSCWVSVMEITKKHKTLVTRRGGMGKGCRIYLLGACDHNCNGVNGNSMGPTPRTNGGVQCFDRKTGNKGLDSHREELCNCFGSPMDAVKLTADDVL